MNQRKQPLGLIDEQLQEKGIVDLLRPGWAGAAKVPERQACRLMVDLLDLADRANVVCELAGVLHHLVEHDEVPDLDSLVERFAPRPTSMPDVQVLLPATAVYDALLEVA